MLAGAVPDKGIDMSTQVTVSLPDETYRRAEHLARLTGRAVADVLSETIHLSLDPLGRLDIAAVPVASMPDAEILALADSQMDTDQDWRLRELLVKQQDGRIPQVEVIPQDVEDLGPGVEHVLQRPVTGGADDGQVRECSGMGLARQEGAHGGHGRASSPRPPPGSTTVNGSGRPSDSHICRNRRAIAQPHSGETSPLVK